MDLRNRYQGRSDDQETQYIPIQETPAKRSDQYDTQELSTEEIRRRISQEQNENARRTGYAGNQGRANNRPSYTQNNSGYSRGYNSATIPPLRNSGNTGGHDGVNYQGNAGYHNQSEQPYGQQAGQPYNRPYVQQPRPQSVESSRQQYNGQYRQQPRLQQRQYQPYSHKNDSRKNNSYNRQSRRSSSSRRSRPLWQSILRFILVLIIAVFLIYSAIAIVGIFRTNIVASASRNRTEDAVNSSMVDNILIIGTDSRDIETDRGRSDSIILLSINSKSNTVYMTSFLRDVYVYINDSYGSGKLNAAYSYGGPELLMDTIESNYDIKIDDYVVVSFAACAAVIDSVGGVEITLSDDEADALNEILISEVNELMGDKRNDDLLEGGGTYNLSGKQALSYSRIRYVGNADFERTSRQREVLSIAMKKACKNPVALCGIFLNALPEISTNIQGLSLYGYSLKAPFMLIGYDMQQQQIPADGTFYSDYINGEDVLVADFTENNNVLLDTVYSGVLD